MLAWNFINFSISLLIRCYLILQQQPKVIFTENYQSRLNSSLVVDHIKAIFYGVLVNQCSSLTFHVHVPGKSFQSRTRFLWKTSYLYIFIPQKKINIHTYFCIMKNEWTAIYFFPSSFNAYSLRLLWIKINRDKNLENMYIFFFLNNTYFLKAINFGHVGFYPIYNYFWCLSGLPNFKYSACRLSSDKI